MKVARVELTRIKVPFKRAFRHAAASRSESDAIIIRVESETGLSGFGEIQARPYVTGETNDHIWEEGGARVGRSLLRASIESPADIPSLLGGEAGFANFPALTGGFDLALHDLLIVAGLARWDQILGPRRTSPVQRCLTIGGDYDGDQLRKQALVARMGRYDVVKLKVSSPDDARRVIDLRRSLGDACRIRLDANGEMTLDSARSMLELCRDARIESLEEPLSSDSPDHIDQLESLHRSTSVPLVADESICTLADLGQYEGRAAYQLVNVRVGKCGGITGTRALLDACVDRGLGVVSGTMVGESAVLLQTSKMLLEHCEALQYVEGIDQADKLLAEQVVAYGPSAAGNFEWLTSGLDKYLTDRQNLG